MDMETIEIVISDHLQTLTSLHDTLANLRLNVQNTKDQETLAFENYVRSTLSKLEQLTMDEKTNVVDSAHSRERKPDLEHDNVGEREGIQMIQEEYDIIERNTSFMEGIEEPEEEAERGDGKSVGAEEDSVDDFLNDLMEEDDGAVSRIQLELRNTEQAILDFDGLLRHLERERLCAPPPPRPRRYDQGHIDKAHRFMRCAFSKAFGHHYSDSCTVVRGVASRNQLVESNRRFKQCLEVICVRGLACKKNLTTFFYCRLVEATIAHSANSRTSLTPSVHGKRMHTKEGGKALQNCYAYEKNWPFLRTTLKYLILKSHAPSPSCWKHTYIARALSYANNSLRLPFFR
uniref:Uncharacterized protein n=1 Tax=Haemonchus placei TaxID=6290 RepID=A0A0N4X991_HAEPC